MIEAVVFDMDGVLVDTENTWHEVRRQYVARFGGTWEERHQRDCMGANSGQWARYLIRTFGIPRTEEQVISEVVQLLEERYTEAIPVIPGACSAVRRLWEAGFSLAVASSSPLAIIKFVVERLGLSSCFAALVSSDMVVHGKPEPDVYLHACSRLRVHPSRAMAVEDSASGITAAARAGLVLVAIPNSVFVPDKESLARANCVLQSIQELTPELVRSLAACHTAGSCHVDGAV